jgi:hypothetical protein
MSKRNKIRYQSKGNQFPKLTLTGKVFLRHRDEDTIPAAVKGDLQIFLSTDIITYNTHVGDYDAMGFDGYLKADVHDGKDWRPLSLEEFFPGREYYFGKRERPIDIVNLCMPVFESSQGVQLMRTYREHYVKAEEPAEEKAED